MTRQNSCTSQIRAQKPKPFIKSKTIYLKSLLKYAKSLPVHSQIEHVNLTDSELIELMDILISWYPDSSIDALVTLKTEQGLR
jgi:hypothetical protein